MDLLLENNYIFFQVFTILLKFERKFYLNFILMLATIHIQIFLIFYFLISIIIECILHLKIINFNALIII